MSRFSDGDPRYLRDQQYGTDANLTVRIGLHERFSTNAIGWYGWLFDRFVRPGHASVLEIGAGTAGFWVANTDRVPSHWTITLTDASVRMVATARSAVAPLDATFGFVCADAQSVPFASERFDVVVANHMLYHVPDRPRAIAEMRRVLRPTGFLVAATNGPTHLQELDALARRVAPEAEADDSATAFGLQNGADQLAAEFSSVELSRYADGLEIDDADAVVEFIRSTPTVEYLDEARTERVRQNVDAEIQRRGAFHVTKDVGVFLAR